MSTKNNKIKKSKVGDIVIRQYFYINKQFNKEDIIKALERTYGSQKKSFEQWEEICKAKNINF